MPIPFLGIAAGALVGSLIGKGKKKKQIKNLKAENAQLKQMHEERAQQDQMNAVIAQFQQQLQAQKEQSAQQMQAMKYQMQMQNLQQHLAQQQQQYESMLRQQQAALQQQSQQQVNPFMYAQGPAFASLTVNAPAAMQLPQQSVMPMQGASQSYGVSFGLQMTA